VRIFVSLGSNLGEPEANLAEARRRLAELAGIRLAAASKVYRTEPQNVRDQPWFSNQVVALEAEADWTPEGLLAALKDIERGMGRTDGPRFGPRIIDLDILLFGQERRDAAELSLPHPRLTERAFVLVPLSELAPGLILPDGRPLGAVLKSLSHRVEKDVIWQP